MGQRRDTGSEDKRKRGNYKKKRKVEDILEYKRKEGWKEGGRRKEDKGGGRKGREDRNLKPESRKDQARSKPRNKKATR